MGTGDSFPGVKQPGREADNSDWLRKSTGAEVKKMWLYTSTSPYVFMAQCLISYAHRHIYLIFTVLKNKKVVIDGYTVY
jgi:hypothetical protein